MNNVLPENAHGVVRQGEPNWLTDTATNLDLLSTPRICCSIIPTFIERSESVLLLPWTEGLLKGDEQRDTPRALRLGESMASDGILSVSVPHS